MASKTDKMGERLGKMRNFNCKSKKLVCTLVTNLELIFKTFEFISSFLYLLAKWDY